MNILLTTLGYSWQIVPELVGLTNPGLFRFYEGNLDARSLREKHRILPADECWIVTVSGADAIVSQVRRWCKAVGMALRVIVCDGVAEFSNEDDVLAMRTCIFQGVMTAIRAKGQGGALYLSLAGGRKTMSADMQEAGNLFGCDLLLHVTELPGFSEAKEEFLSSSLETPGGFGSCFMPLVISECRKPNLLVAESGMLSSDEFQLQFSCDGTSHCSARLSLLTNLSELQNRATRLFTNFSAQTDGWDSQGRDAFFSLYLLPPEAVQFLKSESLGEHHRRLLSELPKCDLHSHLGGVLSPEEIVDVALCAKASPACDDDLFIHEVRRAVEEEDRNALLELKRRLFKAKEEAHRFERTVAFIKCFRDSKSLFRGLVYGFSQESALKGIGIDAYQRLGDFQGSALLQSEETIRAALRRYLENLKKDNVGYVELRCSPYKYTRSGLDPGQVVSAILDEMENGGVPYRLIFIIGRDASVRSMERTVQEIISLYDEEPRLRMRLSGIDLAGAEGAAAPKDVREVFLPLLERCLHVTIHAGETESVDNIWQAVYYLSADRIGHGLCLLDNPALFDRFVDKRIGVEMCPSSNFQVVGGFPRGYPLKQYMKRGLCVTLNTDNMGISGTTVTDEFFRASRMTGGITLWDCLVLIRNSLDSAFCDEATKRRLVHSFEQQIFSTIQKELGT